jgi:hypothetical protein
MNRMKMLGVACLIACAIPGREASPQAPPPAAPSYNQGGSGPINPFAPAPPHAAGTYCYTTTGWCVAEAPGQVSAPCTCPSAPGQPPRKGTLH